MPLYELINPSDPYTFRAASIEVAGVAVAMLNSKFGARCVENSGEATPVWFGWSEWLEAHGIDGDYTRAHLSEIADALDSFLIGNPADRADVEDMLAILPADKRAEWRARRQDRHRSSVNDIGEAAYALAERLRRVAAHCPQSPIPNPCRSRVDRGGRAWVFGLRQAQSPKPKTKRGIDA